MTYTRELARTLLGSFDVVDLDSWSGQLDLFNRLAMLGHSSFLSVPEMPGYFGQGFLSCVVSPGTWGDLDPEWQRELFESVIGAPLYTFDEALQGSGNLESTEEFFFDCLFDTSIGRHGFVLLSPATRLLAGNLGGSFHPFYNRSLPFRAFESDWG